MNIEEVLRLHARWINGDPTGVCANLINADLRGADLSHTDLSSADLRCANLINADLRGADLRYVNLKHADLSNADLSDADLRHADLRRADLRRADLRRADLRHCIGHDSKLTGLALRGLAYPVWVSPDGTIISIGCQTHSVEEWKSFDDETIQLMDPKALEFWREWKTAILGLAK